MIRSTKMPRGRKAKNDVPVVGKNTPVASSAPSANDEQNPNDDKAKARQQASKDKIGVASAFSFLGFAALAYLTTNIWAPIFYFSVFVATSSFILLLITATADKNLGLSNKNNDRDVDALAKTLIASDRSFVAKYNRIKAHFAKVETLETIERQSPLIHSTDEFNTAMVQQYVATQLKAALDAQGQDKQTVTNNLMDDLNDLDVYADAKIKTLKAKTVIRKMRNS